MSDVETASALIEALDGHGRVQWRERLLLAGEKRRFTIGRALDADITLDDPYAAAMHAAIEIRPDGRVFASVLDSANGIVVAGKRHHATTDLEVVDGLLQVGRTRLRVRTTYDPLAPEKPDQLRPASIIHDPAWIAGIGAAFGITQVIYTNWLDAPRDLTSVAVTSLISASVVIGIWVAFWALLSRVILGKWRWLRHTAIILGVAVVSNVVAGLLDLAWFALSLPQWPARATLAGGLVVAWALYLHLTNASNIASRRAAFIACIVPALSFGAGHWVQDRMQMRDVNYIDSRLRIYPPGLRLSDADTIDSLFEQSSLLRAAADEKRDATHLDADDAEEINDDD